MINFDPVIFNTDINRISPYPGALLVSEPFLHEAYFSHSVICLIDYAPKGNSMGIVLNKPSGYLLGNLFEKIEENIVIPVYCGGPLSCDRLYFIHTLPSVIPNAKEIAEGLYLGGDFETMIDYVNSGYYKENEMRFFIGYSGWDAGQLDSELKRNVWAVTKIKDTADLLVGENDSYWHRYVRSMGEKYRGWLFHPENPHAN